MTNWIRLALVLVGAMLCSTGEAHAAFVTTGLVLHYAASDYDPSTRIWTNSGSAGIASNATVSATQQPTKVTASDLNGQTAVKFNYTSAAVGFTATYLTSLFSTSQATAFVVFTPGPGISNQYETLWSSARSDTFTSFGNGVGYSGLFRSNRVDSSPASGMPKTGDSGGYLLETDSSSSVFNRIVNGVTKSTATGGTTFLAPGTLHIGGNNTPNSSFVGEIAQVLVYNRLLTSQEQRQDEVALLSQYGLSIPSAPEPASLSLLGLGSLLMLRRRLAR